MVCPDNCLIAQFSQSDNRLRKDFELGFSAHSIACNRSCKLSYKIEILILKRKRWCRFPEKVHDTIGHCQMLSN